MDHLVAIHGTQHGSYRNDGYFNGSEYVHFCEPVLQFRLVRLRFSCAEFARHPFKDFSPQKFLKGNSGIHE